MSTETVIHCGHCHGTHSAVWEVRACAGAPAPTPPPPPVSTGPAWRDKEVTSAQEYKVKALGGDVAYAKTLTRGTCSDYIGQLMFNPTPVASPEPAPAVVAKATAEDPIRSAPNRVKSKIPMDFLRSVPDGYYAARPDSNHHFTFFRVSRPTKGHYKDTLKIQTQHGPDLKLFMVIWPDDRLEIHNLVPEDDFLFVTVDPNGTGMAYAQELQRCTLCGTELTDARSRWYCVGPDCEKKYARAQIIMRNVEETKGPFKYGSGD
jgi:hypothetical protein